jgi:hypothetical protein
LFRREVQGTGPGLVTSGQRPAVGVPLLLAGVAVPARWLFGGLAGPGGGRLLAVVARGGQLAGATGEVAGQQQLEDQPIQTRVG